MIKINKCCREIMEKNLHYINSATFSSTSEVTLCKGHMHNKHEVDKHKSCPHCDFRGARISNIHKHIDGHHAELYEKQFDCHHCSRWSTCPLAIDCWLLNHVIYLKLRKKKLLAKLGKLTK